MAKPINKVVLAYSGGLDTSAMLLWLKETYGCEVICYCADVGQGEELAGLEEKAKATGASKLYVDRVTGAKKRHHLQNRFYRRPSKTLCEQRRYPNRPCATVFAIRSPLTCLKTVMTFAQFRNCWATKT